MLSNVGKVLETKLPKDVVVWIIQPQLMISEDQVQENYSAVIKDIRWSATASDIRLRARRAAEEVEVITQETNNGFPNIVKVTVCLALSAFTTLMTLAILHETQRDI